MRTVRVCRVDEIEDKGKKSKPKKKKDSPEQVD